MSDRARDALWVLRSLEALDVDPEARWRLELDIAMVTRDAGDAAAALHATRELLARAPDDEARFLAHQSLARTATFLGQHPAAVAHHRAAIELARAPHAHLIPALRAELAALLVAEADVGGALAELTVLRAGLPLPPQAALSAAGAVAAMLERGADVGGALVARAFDDLQDVRDQALAAGDLTVAGSALRVRARLHELAGDPDSARSDWRELLRQADDPLAMASLAALHWERLEADEARAWLTATPDALQAEHEHARDVGELIDSTGRLNGALRRLATAMMAGRPTPDDVRLACELARDAIGRTRAGAAAVDPPRSRAAMAGGLRGASLAALAPANGALWVLEWWLGADSEICAIQTRVDAAARVAARPLPVMPAEPATPPEIADEVLARLQGWRTDRAGDPLDHPGWQRLAHWLRDAMSDADDGDHLVVIEHAVLAGLPWHAIGGVRWTTSYAPGWAALLDLPVARAPASTAVVSVTARGDADSTLDAFSAGVERARADAAAHAVAFEALAGDRATAPAVLQLLERSDLVVVQCHGLIDPPRLDMALLVAHGGQLPTQHPIAAASDHARGHRVTWRDLQDVRHGPQVVLSAACSTGQGLLGGLGERLGIYGALRASGTRAVVAPAWDAVATDAPALVADVRRMILDGVPVARAVKAAEDAAAERLPAWRARVLCVDGDWR
jgi:CHAT domain